jgi:hypothetical protein
MRRRRSSDIHPLSAPWLHHQGVRAESSAVKVIFEGWLLPKKVYIDYLRYPVRPFVLATLRCFRCQGVGHVAGGCTGPRKCLLCAGPHDKSECPHSTGLKRTCANCGGPHSASARECPVIVGARAVEKLRATGLSYADAAKKVRQLPADALATQGTLTRPAGVKQTPQILLPTLHGQEDVPGAREFILSFYQSARCAVLCQ